MTRTHWKLLHALLRLLSIPFLAADIVIRLFTLGFWNASPYLWWATNCLVYCSRLGKWERNRRRETMLTTSCS